MSAVVGCGVAWGEVAVGVGDMTVWVGVAWVMVLSLGVAAGPQAASHKTSHRAIRHGRSIL